MPPENHPPAPPENIVVCDHARFTILYPRLIRLEWAEDTHFEDRATLAVCNRHTPAVPFSRKETAHTLTLDTGELKLVYRKDGKPLGKGNLKIHFRLHGTPVTWWPGKTDRRNLQGTARTLDNANGSTVPKWVDLSNRDPDKPIRARDPHTPRIWQGDRKKISLGDGLISRSGWAVVDDSTAVVLDPEICEWQPWVREREPGRRQDLYFLGYGHAYTDALREAQTLFGRQPLPPRYALGYWYSRYWAYTDKELNQLVDDFDRAGLPLDVLVIDMDWHKPGWTGYSWDPDYFPHPEAFLNGLHARGLKITLNLHPADGVFDFEDAFPDMLREMGLTRADLPDLEPDYHRLYELIGRDPHTAKRIPLDICDPVYMRAYFKTLHHPHEDMGIDFWWMDWQQGNQGSRLPRLDTLPWINELHWQDQERRSGHQRPLNFSRFGGLGAGRMPVGFSGDTHATWDSLAYQPRFTATAANVLFGTWSHDIGGHMHGELTPELYTRWIQFGIYSPIFRTHTSKAPECERRVFHFPDPHRSAMTRACLRRYELVPYIYGQLRRTYDTGVSLLHPMYYAYPEEEAAYRAKDQYFFGADMLVAPVIRPMDPDNGHAKVSVWLPQGKWWDTALGGWVEGGRRHTRHYTLEEIPVFVRPGTVIPEQEATQRLAPGSYPTLIFRIYPGKAGKAALYEDDGQTRAWKEGVSAEIICSHRKRGATRTITLHPAQGRFPGFQTRRRVKIILEGGAPLRHSSHGEHHYQGDTAANVIDLGEIDLVEGHTVKLREATPHHQQQAEHLKGLMNRLEKVRALTCQVSPPHPVFAGERLPVRAAQTGNRLSMRPETFPGEIDQLHSLLQRLPRDLHTYAEHYRDPKTGDLAPKGEIIARAERTLRLARKQLS